MATNMLAHNQPPPDADPLAERLAEQYGEITARADKLLEAEDRIPDSLTEDTVGRASDYARQLKACAKLADDARKAEKEPFLTAERTVDAWFGAISGRLKGATNRVEQRVGAFLRAKEAAERKAREEEARRLAAEAKALSAAGNRQQAKEVRAESRDVRDEARNAKAADLVRTHTGMGGVATLKQTWAFEIVDLDQVDLNRLKPQFSLAHVEQAIRGFVRAGGRELAGVKIFQDRKASIR